jgi:hypothetical protein
MVTVLQKTQRYGYLLNLLFTVIMRQADTQGSEMPYLESYDDGHAITLYCMMRESLG